MGRVSLFVAAAAPLALVWSSVALAQDTPPKAAADDTSEDEEIIVTARKREESILRVPVVETVLTQETLERSQIVDLYGITTKVPGLQLGGNVLTVGTQIALRGVGTSSLDAGVDQSVSVNIDGLQFSQGATFSVGLFDMAQIEVLKGPQSLFYGKSSPGGVVSIRTADPGDELEVIARLGYEFYAHERRAELIISGPLSDTLGLRAAIMHSGDDGYFRNKAFAQPGTGARDPSSNRYNDTDQFILRGTAVWTPSSNFRARLKMNHAEMEVIGGGSPLGSCPDGVATPRPLPTPLDPFLPANLQFINPNETCKVDRDVYIVDLDPAAFPEVRRGGVPGMKYRQTFGTLELDYDFTPQISLNSTTGYFKTTIDGLINGVNSGFAGPSLIADNHFTRRDFTQEVRLQSDFADKPFDFLLGGYYQDAQVANRIWVGGNTRYFLPATLTGGINDVSIKTWALFGQLLWRPVSELEIALGARYTDEKRHDDTFLIFGSINATPTPVNILRPNLRSKNWSPELTITYTPTDDLTVFAALKQGYKSGSYIMTVPPPVPPVGCAPPGPCDNSFNDERVRGGEIGIKTRLMDRSLTLNLAGYYYRYSDLQVGSNETAQGTLPIIRTINAASAKVYGIDFDVNYRPRSVPGLSTWLAINWNHARFVTFNNAPCLGGQTIAEGCNLFFNSTTGRFQGQDLSGARLPKAADWQIYAGVDYEMDVGSNLKLALAFDGQYSSKFLRGLNKHRDDLFQPGYVKLNANVTLKSADDAWEVALIGNNLTNKFTAGNCTVFSAASGQILGSPLTGAAGRNNLGIDELACIPDKGRQIFLRLTLRPSAM